MSSSSDLCPHKNEWIETCTLDDYLKLDPNCDARCYRVKLGPGDRIGLALVGQCCLISILTLTGLFLWGLLCKRSQLRGILNNPFNMLIISLFSGDFVQALGGVYSVSWSHRGEVTRGSLCAAQGSTQQIGETAVAMSTLFIAFYTFAGYWFNTYLGHFSVGLSITFIWGYVSLYTVIAAKTLGVENYEGPTPFWCWIDERYLIDRIMGQYIWLWLVLFVSLAYVPLSFFYLGVMTWDGRHPSWDWSARIRQIDRQARQREARNAILYPVVYSIIVLPLCVIRWRTFQVPGSVPSAGTFFSVALYGLSGVANVILVLSTQRGLLPPIARPPPIVELAPGQQPFDMEMNRHWGAAEIPVDNQVPRQDMHDGDLGNLVDRHGLNDPGRRMMHML